MPRSRSISKVASRTVVMGAHSTGKADIVTPRILVALAFASLCLAGCGGDKRAPAGRDAPEPDPAALPRPHAPLPREPAALADALTSTTRALRSEIERWRRDGDPAAGSPPAAVTLLALHQQRIYRRIAPARRLGDRVLALLPASVAGEARDTVRARRALIAIPPSGNRRPRISTAAPEPADRLRAHYTAAQRRFGVGWHVLAAINFVESAFGRLRNESTAGARGPMQFIPATWRAYGLGGDIRDPRDAVLGAANYLHANGAPRSYRRALFHYNRSPHYVAAILHFARRIHRDPRAFYAYYAWQVYVRRDGRVRRITGPGA
jgi:membrane-bound lytic murein transglycosylase B